ncbi:hypothetical protein IWW38_002596, partial [Coemansia aciculifera]
VIYDPDDLPSDDDDEEDEILLLGTSIVATNGAPAAIQPAKANVSPAEINSLPVKIQDSPVKIQDSPATVIPVKIEDDVIRLVSKLAISANEAASVAVLDQRSTAIKDEGGEKDDDVPAPLSAESAAS